MRKRERKSAARRCETCRSHRKNPNSEDGWYCNIHMRWLCSKSKEFTDMKDYSHETKKGGLW
jgi:hypothetical protein